MSVNSPPPRRHSSLPSSNSQSSLHNGVVGHNMFETPIWVPDSEAFSCAVCDKPFTFKRRKHQ